VAIFTEDRSAATSAETNSEDRVEALGESWTLTVVSDEPESHREALAPTDYVTDWGFGDDGDRPIVSSAAAKDGDVEQWLTSVHNFLKQSEQASVV
jgi:hypothetical protein